MKPNLVSPFEVIKKKWKKVQTKEVSATEAKQDIFLLLDEIDRLEDINVYLEGALEDKDEEISALIDEYDDEIKGLQTETGRRF